MSSIHRLSDSTINLISAGEVILNPASVVKELVENSIDAGATKIEIWLENGGKTFIVVKDNGIGMSLQDLRLCAQRYTTSKLDQADLYNIATLGFRGEALASILAVSRLCITTRYHKGHDAYKLNAHLDFQIQSAVFDVGTKIEVRDLFYTTPARLKFLKSDKIEASTCLGVVKNIALAHPFISFACYLDHKEVFHASCSKDLSFRDCFRSRVSLILGQDFVNSSIEMSFKEGLTHISGLISIPTYTRASSFEQIFFVNSRFVKDPILKSCLKRAYSDVVPYGRHPVAVVMLEIDPYFVDVNVHPAKTEVRFRAPKDVSYLLVEGIKNLISSSANVSIERAYSDVTFDWPSSETRYSIANNFNESESLFESSPPYLQSLQQSPQELEDGNSFPLGSACFQFNGTFIVSRTANSVVIVDQHAAHERIVYESVKESFLHKSIESQPLLVPVKIQIASDLSYSYFQENQNILRQFGLHIEVDDEEKVVLVHAIPLVLLGTDIAFLIRDLEDDFLASKESQSLQDKIEYICKTWACHNSIRANRSLSVDEMNQILRMIESTSNAGQCNHGRPSYVKFTSNQIAKWFERT